MTDIVLSIAGTVFGEPNLPLEVDLQLAGGPFSFTLKLQKAISIGQVWDVFSSQLESVTGISLPTIPPGPWHKIMDEEIYPSLWITPDSGSGKTSAFLQLTLKNELPLGTHFSVGPIDVQIEPDITITGILIGYDGGGGGLTVKAKIKTAVHGGAAHALASPSKQKEQLVNFPFPLPAQNSLSSFRLNYLGIGQRIGPNVQLGPADDPMAKIFEQLETQLVGTDPQAILTTLASQFYAPDRDWFIAADMQLREFQLRILFNDPVMYGLELNVPPGSPPSFFDGLLFEILYQKLGPNLGVYYGALTLPYAMRRIPMEGFILILPGFSIWVYTDGDFRVNVGWPVSPDNSIGISFDILTGWAGFYFAKLSSGDNPGALPGVYYDLILEFGMGVAVSANVSISAGPLSASLSASLAATFQGLLAWKTTGSGGSISNPPDHMWFAGTASIAVVLQGCVDLAILKASILVSFSASAGVAFETGYQTVIPVSASVSVRVSIKVVIFTIHLSFDTTVSHTFHIGTGTPASINGPLAAGLTGLWDTPAELLYAEARARASAMRLQMAASLRPLHDAWEPLRFAPAPVPFAELDVVFILQPTVVYDNSGQGALSLIASLIIDAPAPDQPALASPGAATGYEVLIVKLVKWLLTFAPAGSPDSPLSATLQALSSALGSGGEPGSVFGGLVGFTEKLRSFLTSTMRLTIRGLSVDSPLPFDAVAVLPMFDALRLQTDLGICDFLDFNRTPDNYASALSQYFENMGLVGQNVPPNSASPSTRAPASPPSGPSIASFMFGDYFLLIARYAVSTLLHDARAYEATQESQLKAWAKQNALGAPDPFDTATVLHAYAAATNPTQELSYLLDHLSYWGIAGFGSRYLMSGLQLIEPAHVPARLSPPTVAAIPTAPLYVLSGQQYTPGTGRGAGTATLSFAPGQEVAWVQFAGGSPASAMSRLDLPAVLPAAPDPHWIDQDSPSSPGLQGPDTLLLQPLATLTSAPLGYQLKNSTPWISAVQAGTLFALPQPLRNLLQSQAPLQLALSGVADNDGLATVAVEGLATLQIRLSLTQVAGTMASPHASPGPAASPQMAYLPDLYQLNGTDEATRDLIAQALKTDLSGASIRLLYLPAGETSWVADQLDPMVLLAKLNLSTLNQVQNVSAAHARLLAQLHFGTDANAALLTNAQAFLRLVWELSVIDAPGYFLYYRNDAGHGLPSDLFSDTAAARNSPADPARKTVPGTASGTAEVMILVQFGQTPSAQLTLSSFQNGVAISADSHVSTLVCSVSDPPGEPLMTYHSAYAPGHVGFAASWTPALPASPPPSVPVDELYHLIQYQLVGTGTRYADSVWSLPVGPTGSDPLHSPDSPASPWKLRQLVRLLPFFDNAASPPVANPYATVGCPVNLAFRLCDIYGNALNALHTRQFTPSYSDPLIALSAWPGLQCAYYFEPSTVSAAAATVCVVLDFHLDLVQHGHLPGTAPQWTSMRDKYQCILDQLGDPNTHFSLTCSLVDNASLGDPRAPLLELATSIFAYLGAQLGNDRQGSLPSSPGAGLTQQFSFELPFAALAGQADNIVDIGVCIRAQRDLSLVDSAVLSKLPQAASVSAPLFAKLDLPSLKSKASPGVFKNDIGQFAARFEQAFDNFDAQGGMLKLAQRSGIQHGDNAEATADLWSVRFGTGQGFQVALSGALTYFALRPLNNAPRSSAIGDVQYNDVDLDAWASEFFHAFDAFLSPQMGVAVALLDQRNGTTYYDQLLQSKQTLAHAVPSGMVAVLRKDESAPAGALQAAHLRLEQAMLDTLSNAYTVSTIVQVPAAITVGSLSADASPAQHGPQLYGTFGQPPGGSPQADDGAGKLYQFSPVGLDLATGTQWATSLLSVTKPGNQSQLKLPLEYMISYVQHNFGAALSGEGYIPSSWLKFALPGTAKLRLPLANGGLVAASPEPMAVIPVPLSRKPSLPVLLTQSGQGVALASPATGDSLSDEIRQALQWCYQVELSLDLVSQDQFFFDLTKNVPAENAKSVQKQRRQHDAQLLDRLFKALAQFKARYPALAQQFGSILQQTEEGAAVVQQVYSIADEVANAWPTDWEPKGLQLDASSDIDHFCLSYIVWTSSSGELRLRGRTDSNDNPAIWPALESAQASASPDKLITWRPDRGQATRERDDDGQVWWVVTHPFSAPWDFSPLRMTWEPLGVLDYQSALLSAWVVRNANLIAHEDTNPLFIYQTDETRFANAMVPLIERDTLPEVDVGAISLANLQQIMEDIMLPLSEIGSATVRPMINLQANYAYALVANPAGQSLMAQSPVTLISALELDTASPGTIAAEVAQEIWSWYQRSRPPTTLARMEFAFTLFGTVDGQQLPLVQINKIPVVFS